MADVHEGSKNASEAGDARRALLHHVSSEGLPGLIGKGDTPRGECTGLLLGVKPAVLVDAKAIPSDARSVLEAAGVEPVLENGILINPTAIYLRLATEPEFADWAGWNPERTLEENLRNVSSKIADEPKRNALAGFVLGYPESAVRAFVRELEIEMAGVPDFRALVAWTMNGFRKEKSPKVLAAMDEPWVKEAAVELRRLKDRAWEDGIDGNEQTQRFGDEELFLRGLAPKAEELYRRIFALSEDDAKLMAFDDDVEIRNPAGQAVFVFKVFGKDATADAEDVKALRRRVEEAFAQAW